MLTYKTLGDAPRGFFMFFICFVALVIYNKLKMSTHVRKYIRVVILGALSHYASI